ncbi:hypothetical protein [Vibrio alginolyticus]|uniref:hypothetical protein n=1 Tax=Vibrio alginolyticus TaxID=663 RepID=UPI0022AA72E3|nr:hypothetical protein [Vibrio alginolyticus]MCZ2802848.1 hypothetical protein [Vibrio alginolyticus]
MNKNLMEKYRNYAASGEAYAVLFVKENLNRAKGHWVDIIDFQQYEMSSNNSHFRFVNGGLYKRKITPKYPPKSKFTVNGIFNKHEYYLAVRAITWDTAQRDIQKQKSQKVKPIKFNIRGVCYDKNRNKFFRDEAPHEIKKLAENLSDRTNPLWDVAEDYFATPDFVYEIRHVSITK